MSAAPHYSKATNLKFLFSQKAGSTRPSVCTRLVGNFEQEETKKTEKENTSVTSVCSCSTLANMLIIKLLCCKDCHAGSGRG
jgi:hypothetical protein